MATVDIPEPPAYPIIGHAALIDPSFPLGSFQGFADKYGEIFRMRFPGSNSVVVTTQALVNEVCDEKRFKKIVAGPLGHIRRGVHNGLFTAHDGEEPWGIAHRVLMPAFGPLKIRNMFEEMHDLATQLALKWARVGPDTHVQVSDDFTRLTLDTIALCSMGYRFNSFYSEDMHPFVQAMADFLTECGEIDRRPLPGMFYRAKDQKLVQDIEIMRKTAEEIVVARKNGTKSESHNDLLTEMLDGVDPKTGKKMTDQSIMDNLITFLIAGHETTSGMLSYSFYQMLTHPETFTKAQQEVDAVCGKGPITVDHLSKLPYINGVLRETLRLTSTIGIFALTPIEDTVIGNKYFVKKDQAILTLVSKLHQDASVYGDDALEFKPERMMDENFNRLNKEFPNCWKPFGNGKRSCIGRPFAWQEALLIMAMLLQNFNFVMAPGYTLSHKQTLTVKPNGFTMRPILRDGLTPTTLERRLAGSLTETNDPKAEANLAAEDTSKGVPLTVLYGSNSGTCKSLAQQIVVDGAAHGFRTVKMDCLDSVKGSLPTDHPVVIVTASFEGEPPDNAGHFVSWLQSLKDEEKALKGVSYAVFGCGHSDWVSTYQRIPKLVNSRLEALGAKQLAPLGATDVSTGATFTDFEGWEDGLLWPALGGHFGGSGASTDETRTGGVKVVVSNPRNETLRQDVQSAVVVETRTLTKYADEKLAKKHVEIKLPTGMKYRAGDYLAVLPVNPKETVQRAMRVLGLSWDAHLEITSDVPVALPVNTCVPASDVLSLYVELSQPATKRNLREIIEFAPDEKTIVSLGHLANDGYAAEITAKKASVLDILEQFPCLNIPVGVFLSMLPPLRVRQYSISSSPLSNPGHATISFAVLHEPSLSGKGTHIGVATSYLSTLQPGDTLHVAVRQSHQAFHLPSDPEKTPLLCMAAGAGIAPFRGFIQERANMIAAGRRLAPAVLFFGCRSPATDDLYREELDEWQRIGAVDVRRAYSRETGAAESKGCKYVQDRAWHDREELMKLWKEGAKVYVCGSKAVGESVKEVMIRMRKEMVPEGEQDDEKLQEWFNSLRNVRYVVDVFD
ncbi:unnamed protein product [Clonostachys rosea]|uniref:Bifunctional cytochrome P450/NADPH--P450 reductase n=1 Tax=Bionectria ochroleuca TaxID=29856 RepID=A0ABY6ULV2_BIOOC|nr:unnamed protein product [Clonostachys rosea]